MNFLNKFFLKFFPQTFLRWEARKLKVDKRLDACLKLFDGAKRVDFFPLTGGHRGFMIVIDNAFSLWFFQNEDHFVFDGYEMGEYENGNVTVMDSCRVVSGPFKE